MTTERSVVLSPDLERECQKEINDPAKQAFYGATGRTSSAIRTEYEKKQRERNEREALVSQWVSLNDEEFLRGFEKLS